MCADAEVICCETVINPLEMFPHMTAAADNDDDDDIKFIFTIRYYMQTLSPKINGLEHTGYIDQNKQSFAHSYN